MWAEGVCVVASGDGWGIEKDEERDLPLSALLSLLIRWRLPTLPLSQYHRRDEV